jgi:hypothetical protein
MQFIDCFVFELLEILKVGMHLVTQTKDRFHSEQQVVQSRAMMTSLALIEVLVMVNVLVFSRRCSKHLSNGKHLIQH